MLFIGVALILSSCAASLVPKMVKKSTNSTELEDKGRAILEKVKEAHGSDVLTKHSTYQFTATDDWKGMMSGIGKLWPQKNTNMTFKYIPNTFDSQLIFNDGKTKGNIAGLQSWNYYEQNEGGKLDFSVKKNKKFTFGLAAFQYFTELPGRLSNAQIIRYAGEEELNGKMYDLVFVTWKQEKANRDVDQYIIYINKETSMLDYAIFTLRDNYLKMPGAGMMHGSIQFSNFKNIDGFMVPFRQSIFMMDPKKKESKYLHQLTISEFKFDSFNKAELYPDSSINPIGDDKISSN